MRVREALSVFAQVAVVAMAAAAMGVQARGAAGDNPDVVEVRSYVLTLDKGTSRLAQGPSAQTTLVEIEKFIGDAPPISAFDPPIR